MSDYDYEDTEDEADSDNDNVFRYEEPDIEHTFVAVKSVYRSLTL